MKTLRATPGPKGWTLTLHSCSAANNHVEANVAEALVRGRDLLVEWFDTAVAVPEEMRLELAKSAIDFGEILLGLADFLVAGCIERPNDTHEVSGPGEALSILGFERLMLGAGLKVRRNGRRAVSDRLLNLLAIATALAIWLILLVRAPRSVALPEASGSIVYALHGELSNRTRHLLSTLATNNRPSSILVVGTPKRRLAAIARLWSSVSDSPLPPLRTPWSRSSLLGGLKETYPTLREYQKLVDRAPIPPPWRARVGQIVRAILGAASAKWWLEQKGRPVAVVFGHTGTADTHLLERAIQSTGVTTIHAVHGLSGGLNFTAFSDVAIWRCGLDAKWHNLRKTYSSNLHFASSEVAGHLPGASVDTVVLTNLAHPGNTQYRIWGIQPELEALKQVAEGHGGQRSAILWKRHPASRMLPLSQQKALLVGAAGLGISLLPEDCSLDDEMAKAGVVVCTPSTLLLDAMLVGRLPEVIGDLRWSSHLVFRDPQVREQLHRRQFQGEDSRVLGEVWRLVSPAEPVSFNQVRSGAGLK